MLAREISAKTAFLPYKNLATALLFSLFFGPLGLLYASVRAGIFMILVAFVVINSRLPVPIIIMWISSCIWSVMATNRYNHKLMQAWNQNNQ